MMLKRICDFLAFAAELAVIVGHYIWRKKAFFIFMVIAIFDTIMFLILSSTAMRPPESANEWAHILANTFHLNLMGILT